MRLVKVAISQVVILAKPRTLKLANKAWAALEHSLMPEPEGLTGIVLQGELSTLSLVEGMSEHVESFLELGFPSATWLRYDLASRELAPALLYPGLALRLRKHCAVGEIMAFAMDLRRAMKSDVVWQMDNKTLAHHIDSSSIGTREGIAHVV
jgi:hypothetical protein